MAGNDLLPYRVTLLEMYGAIAEFYPAKNKTLQQPPGLPKKCPLKTSCQLLTNEAVFGCKDETGPVTDILVLIDGLPRECEIKIPVKK